MKITPFCVAFQEILLFPPIKHNVLFFLYLTTASSHVAFRGIHNCIACNVLPDYGLHRRLKHVAVVIYVIKILLCSMGEKKNVLPLMVKCSSLLCDLRLGGRNILSFLQCSRGKYVDVFLKEIIKSLFHIL